tara:strand:- start:55 stop:375 length:321 start_codon:yes stop_codon:yes gene_type:complete
MPARTHHAHLARLMNRHPAALLALRPTLARLLFWCTLPARIIAPFDKRGVFPRITMSITPTFFTRCHLITSASANNKIQPSLRRLVSEMVRQQRKPADQFVIGISF